MANLGSCQRDSYLQASFNGVAFEAVETTSEHGRRGAEGEFPFGNNTGYVDMGRKIRRYGFSARLADDDHLIRSTALIAACELPGPGILIHPVRGVLNAACTNLRVRNEIIEGQGVTWIDLEFVEGEIWNNGFGLVGTLLGLALRPLLDASSDQFSATYNVRAEPVYRQRAVTQLAEDTADILATEYNRTENSDPRATADLQQVGDDEILANDPAIMDMTIRRGSAAVAQNSTIPQRKYAAFRRISNWAVNADGSDTRSGAALTSHLRITAGAYMAQAALDRDYATVDQALTALDQVTRVLSQEASLAYDTCDNNLFLTLRQFIADFTRQMYNIAYGQPQVIEYNFGGNISPLQAAYAIWDDATRSRDLSDASTIGPIVEAVP